MSNVPAATLEVWGRWQRCLHWALAATVIASFATHEVSAAWHEWLGYAALACAALRAVCGFTLSGYWRFSQCVRGLGATWGYACAILRRNEKRYLGHNPLGAWMVLTLLANTLLAGGSGWLATTDRFWGVAWVGELHAFSGYAFVPLVLVHIAGGVFTSWRHRENLIAAMVHGQKTSAHSGDVA